MRRALCAWLGSEEGWLTERRSGRVQHTVESEQALTTWMREHLVVSWVEHPAPLTVEGGVIRELKPPLNHQHNRSHPKWPALDAARSRWRDSATD